MTKAEEKAKIVALKNAYDGAKRRLDKANLEVTEHLQKFKDYLGVTPKNDGELDDLILRKLGQMHLDEIRQENSY